MLYQKWLGLQMSQDKSSESITCQKIMRPNTAKMQLRKEGEIEQKNLAEGKSWIERRAVNITFRTESSQEQINKVISKHRNTLTQSSWAFHFGEFKYMNVSDILDHARILQILALTLHFGKHEKILKEIEPIFFPKLTSLNIPGNKITTLEPLQGTKLPALKKLFLRENYLTSLRSLRKCNFHLEILDISDNKLVTIDGLEQLDISSLYELWGYKNKIGLNWSFMKLQANFRSITKLLFYGTITVSPSRLQRELIVRGAQFVRVQ